MFNGLYVWGISDKKTRFRFKPMGPVLWNFSPCNNSRFAMRWVLVDVNDNCHSHILALLQKFRISPLHKKLPWLLLTFSLIRTFPFLISSVLIDLVFVYKHPCFSENKSVFNWTFCQLLMENPNCTKIYLPAKATGTGHSQLFPKILDLGDSDWHWQTL